MVPKYKRDGLPRRVYRKHGAFYYVDRANKWHRLGAKESEMYAALARLTGEDGRTLGAVMDRYMREVMPVGAHLGHRDRRTLERFYLRKPKEVTGL